MGKKAKQKSPTNVSISSNTAWNTESMTSRVNNNDDDVSPENTDAEFKDSLEKIDERTDVEKELYTIISKGDYEAAEKLILENRQDIDITHKNLNGHDLLTHAVECKKKKMISLVLNIDPENVDTEEALLHAIKEDRYGIVLMLLYFQDEKEGGALYAVSKRMVSTSKTKSKTKQKRRGGRVMSKKIDKHGFSDEESPVALPDSFDDSEYGWGMTPFMQAAIHGCYEIMQVLYNRGERLPDFHYQSCTCRLCFSATRDLERTQRRINLLKAQCSPTYMIFMAGQDGSYDPVYEALELSERCKKCKKEEPEFLNEYQEIYESVSKLPVKLLDMCRTCDEVKIFLNQTRGYIGPTSMPYPRLATAMNYDQKEFVGHPKVQFFLQTEFMGPIWKRPRSQSERIAKIGVTLLMMLFFPVIQLFLWFSLFCCSSSPLVRYLLSPINRALSKLASYIFFCILLFFMNKEQRASKDCLPPTMCNIMNEFPETDFSNSKTRCNILKFILVDVRYIVVVYTLALSVALIRRFILNPRAFGKSNWNKFDGVTQFLLWLSYFYWGKLVYQAKTEKLECPVRHELPRDHPILLEECIFAVASTMATLRLLRWYVLSPYLGPFQAAMHRMSKHVPVVLLFMSWSAASFYFSSEILLRPYLNETQEKDGQNKSQPAGLSDIEALFLDFYAGEIGPDDVEIFPINRSYKDSNGVEKIVTNDHYLTQQFSNAVALLWNLIAVKFLQESVTGLFGSTGKAVLKAKDVEWNYDRAKEILHYIQDGHLAPPFNLLPHGACLASFFGWIYATTCGKGAGKTEAGCNFGECCYMRDVENPEELEDKMKEYPFLLKNLFLRYFKSKKEDDDAASKEDVTEVQGKVKELRELCKQISGYESPIKGLSKNSNLDRKESKRVQPNTQPSESNSQQGAQNNNDPILKSSPSSSKKTISEQKVEGDSSVQVVVSPKSKSKNGNKQK